MTITLLVLHLLAISAILLQERTPILVERCLDRKLEEVQRSREFNPCRNEYPVRLDMISCPLRSSLLAEDDLRYQMFEPVSGFVILKCEKLYILLIFTHAVMTFRIGLTFANLQRLNYLLGPHQQMSSM